MKVGEVLGAHGFVLDVADPESAARAWGRALDLPELRRNRSEIVLGSVAFFVVLRRATRESRLAEVHVAVESLRGRGLRADELGGRSRARELPGARLVVRELVGAPSKRWVGKRGRKR